MSLEMKILKRYKSSELQRQSVIVRGSNRKCPQLFLKGAPEAVAARCANMPAAFEDELGSFLYFQIFPIFSGKGAKYDPFI